MRVLKTRWKRLLEERRPGWQANIKPDPENGREDMDWFKSAHDRDHYRAHVKTIPTNVHNFFIN